MASEDALLDADDHDHRGAVISGDRELARPQPRDVGHAR